MPGHTKRKGDLWRDPNKTCPTEWICGGSSRPESIANPLIPLTRCEMKLWVLILVIFLDSVKSQDVNVKLIFNHLKIHFFSG